MSLRRQRQTRNGQMRILTVSRPVSCLHSTILMSRTTAEGAAAKKAKSMKNPAVDTSFLPDRDREERERIEREELRKEWLARQDKMKNETIEVTYSYWDGSGHRKSVEVRLSSYLVVR